jgi:hypothetical protein
MSEFDFDFDAWVDHRWPPVNDLLDDEYDLQTGKRLAAREFRPLIEAAIAARADRLNYGECEQVCNCKHGCQALRDLGVLP